jgi:hypothetical protein
MNKKLHRGIAAAAAAAAIMAGGFAFAKLEGCVPEWKSQPPIPYITGPTPPGWTLNDRFGKWVVKTCRFGTIEAQCSYADKPADDDAKEVKR